MKDFEEKIQYKGEEFGLVFNLNVMEVIQQKYGTVEKWGELTDGIKGEPDAEAIKFGFCEMINEWIDIQNDEGADRKPLTLKQVGRLITDIGFANATQAVNKTVVDSTQSDEKNE